MLRYNGGIGVRRRREIGIVLFQFLDNIEFGLVVRRRINFQRHIYVKGLSPCTRQLSSSLVRVASTANC
jgi:hypothetical protein